MMGDYDSRAIEFGFAALIQPGLRLQMPFQGFCRIERFTNLVGKITRWSFSHLSHGAYREVADRYVEELWPRYALVSAFHLHL